MSSQRDDLAAPHELFISGHEHRAYIGYVNIVVQDLF
jgi:hypothetical protein